MDDAVKLCRDCRHYRDSCCRHQMNLRTDYVNGWIATRNSADFLRSDPTRCGPQGAWWEAQSHPLIEGDLAVQRKIAEGRT